MPPAHTKNRLLDAAAIVVRRDRAQALPLDAVAQEAEVPNGGLLYQPQMGRRVKRDGETIEEPEPVLRRHVSASATTLEVIRRGLYRAVNRRGGTA